MIIPMLSGEISPNAQKMATAISSIMSSYLRMDGWIKCPEFYILFGMFDPYRSKSCISGTSSAMRNDKFTVNYSETAAGESVMTIEMTEAGLIDLNTSKAVYSDAAMSNSGFSDCTLRITYTAKMDSTSDLVCGDEGNDNKVVLTWKDGFQIVLPGRMKFHVAVLPQIIRQCSSPLPAHGL